MPSRPSQVPSFTEADVRAYLALFIHDKTTTGAPATISSIRFITREEASAAMNGESLSEVAPGSLVCYVVIAGPFDVGQSLQLPPTTKKIGPVILVGHLAIEAGKEQAAPEPASR